MIIELPETFTRKNRLGATEVYIEDGILKLRFNVSFKKLMRELTFAKKGNKICMYCGRKINSKKMTVDHLTPQDIGGPTITNNLVPCCSKCNRNKSNMTQEQYLEYLTKKTADERKEYLEKVQYQIEEAKKSKDFSFISNWVVQVPTDKIIAYDENKYYMGEKYHERQAFFQKYGRLKKAIIVDRNYNLLGGFTSLMFAKDNNIKTVPVIILENVEVFFKQSNKK